MKYLKLSIISFAIICSVSIEAIGQKLDCAQGELLVRFHEGVDAQQFRAEINNLRQSAYSIESTKELIQNMNIHRISFDHNRIDERRMLHFIQQHEAVAVVQFNHIIKKRATVPNDPLFDTQWQYINTGQLPNGVLDADLDIEFAWDITTGGVTSAGDTIVACIIDDGLNPNHSDFGDNLWVNHAEIPDNNIDDDNNGYVDDIHGYDIWDDDGDPLTTSNFDDHGTPVAGIVGAKGNNGVGVSGVNWDVKLMIIRGFGDEEEALLAYNYPLKMRTLYNETNGAEGAFVVTTNASWGTDRGQPEDAPLWCAIYDSLGVQGVISCGATANADFNIDEVGDLPTACPSEYLLAVTNLDETDEKVRRAGYGLETIDLGAYGERTETVATPDDYDGFGGTSGATPHVAGAIALLYSAPCNTLGDLAQTNPAAAAILVRDAVLAGVTPNESLDGITVTGGRLNVDGAMQALLATCGPCPSPTGFDVTNATVSSFTVEWVGNDSIIDTYVEYRTVGSTDWTTELTSGESHTITGLTPCDFYEVRARGFCAMDTSAYTSVKVVKTDGCCDIPIDVEIVDITESSVETSWNAVTAADSYTARIRVDGTPTWSEFVTTTNMYTFDVDPCTEYEIQINSNCADSASDYTNVIELITPGCGFCLDLDYCESPQGDTDFEFIKSFSFGVFDNESGDNDGYADFTEMALPHAERNRTYTVSIVPGRYNVDLDENYSLWIDFNANGDFDNDEEVLRMESQDTLGVTAEVTIPNDAALGAVRMRLAMRWMNYMDACQTFDIVGEVEEYCLTIDRNSGVNTTGPESLQFEIYPNPMMNELVFKTNDYSISDGRLLLMDQAGKIVRNMHLDIAQNAQKTIRVSDLSSGVYIARYISDDGSFSFTKKLIKL